MVRLKSEHNSVAKERETAQLAVAAAMASSTRLKEHTEQLEREKVDILNEINVNKQEKEEQEMKAKAMLNEAQRLTTLSTDIKRENENMRDVLKEAQQEILSLKLPFWPRIQKSTICSRRFRQSNVTNKPTHWNWKNSSNDGRMRAKRWTPIPKKRAKIKSMNIILSKSKQIMKKKRCLKKKCEVELKLRLSQRIEINAK